MFIPLKILARTVILPPASPLILAVVGLFLMSRRRRLGVALVVIGLSSLWVCSMTVVSDVLTHFAERYPPLDPSKPVDAQAMRVRNEIVHGVLARRVATDRSGYHFQARARKFTSSAPLMGTARHE